MITIGRFLKIVRSSTAFIFTWLTTVWMIIKTVANEQSFQLKTLWQLLALAFLWAVVYASFYAAEATKRETKPPFKKFTVFMTVAVTVESFLIYQWGLFGITTLPQWGIFVGIIIVLYAASMGIFEIYKRHASRRYTALLRDYQEGAQNNDVGKP